MRATPRKTKLTFAPAFAKKGSTGTYAANETIEYMNQCKNMVLKSDHENYMKHLVEDLCVARTGAKTIINSSPLAKKGT